MALIEHPEICDHCAEWQSIKNRRFVEHDVPREARNAHERRAWKKHGKPKCRGTGKPVWSGQPTTWIDDGR